MILLLGFSLVSWFIIFERIIRYRQARLDVEAFMAKIKKLIQTQRYVEAGDVCQETPGPVAATLKAGLRHFEKGVVSAREAMERVSAMELIRLEHMLSTLATVGSVSPFVGLFGTVLGIINAFTALAGNAAAGPTVVANGIAEALVATAAGLFTAVPAVIAYNFFVRRVTRFDTEMATAASDLLDAMYAKEGAEEGSVSGTPAHLRPGRG
jgi:biopolymer transport protein ExbB/TolQ